MRLKEPRWKQNRRATHCCGRPMWPKTFYLRGAARAVLACQQCGRMVVTEVQTIQVKTDG